MRPLTDDARVALDDSFHFLKFFCGLDLEEQPHRKVTDAIEAAERHEVRGALIQLPRGYFKSSIASGALAWKLARRAVAGDYYFRIAVASAGLALTENILARVEAILRPGGYNQRLLGHFEGKLWRERSYRDRGSRRPEGIFIDPRLSAGEKPSVPEPNIWTASLKRLSTGFHADELYLDDLNLDTNTQTVAQREKVHRYFALLEPILVHDQTGRSARKTYTCTMWHDDDVRGRIERRVAQEKAAGQPPSWSIVKMSVYTDETETASTFPARFPLEVIAEIRANMPTELFSANYRNDSAAGNAFVPEHLIKFIPRERFPALQWCRVAIDPNQHREAKSAGCYFAIVAAGFDRFGKMYVTDVTGSREWTSAEALDELFRLRERYPSWKFLCEESHMAHFEQAIRLEEARRTQETGDLVRLRMNWVPIDIQLSKYARYSKLEPRFRNHAIVFADDIAPALQNELRDELVRGDKARFQDFLDALAIADTGFRLKHDATGKPQPRPEPPPAESALTMRKVFGDDFPFN